MDKTHQKNENQLSCNCGKVYHCCGGDSPKDTEENRVNQPSSTGNKNILIWGVAIVLIGGF